MKTHAIEFQATASRRVKSRRLPKLDTATARKRLLTLLAALLPALALLTLSLWAAGISTAAPVSAAYWASAFLFFALSVDSESGRGKWFALSGLALMTLAWLNGNVAPEFGVLAGLLLSGWVGIALFRRLHHARAAKA